MHADRTPTDAVRDEVVADSADRKRRQFAPLVLALGRGRLHGVTNFVDPDDGIMWHRRGHVETIGDYAVGRVLGEGATGRVVEATDRRTGRAVALKIMHADLTRTDAVRDKVVAELGALARLVSPHAATCLECRVIDGKVVLAFELLQGETLRARIERGRLPWHEAVTIAIQIGQALIAAHDLDPPLLHRDLKPESIMLTQAGAKVTDFAIAKVLGAAGQTTTATFGNIRYMSPEQIDAWGIDARSDLYCLGLVLYEMLVGRQPFSGNSPRELINAQCTLPPPPFPPEITSTVPADLERIVGHLLEKSPDARPPDARHAVALLQSVLHGQPVAIAATHAAASRPSAVAVVPMSSVAPPRASKTPVALVGFAALAAVAIIVGGVAWFFLAGQDDRSTVVASTKAADPNPVAPVPAKPDAKRPVAPPPKVNEPERPTPTPPPDPVVQPPPPDVDPDPDPDPEPPTESRDDSESVDDATAADAAEPEPTVAPNDPAVAMLLGTHKCGIHWISARGTCEIKRDGNALKISGSQGGSGDFFKISGKIRVLSDRTFVVDGTLDSRVSSCCGRRTLSGSFKFQRSGGRKFWRLQDPMRSKICHPTQTCMYYIDVFMK